MFRPFPFICYILLSLVPYVQNPHVFMLKQGPLGFSFDMSLDTMELGFLPYRPSRAATISSEASGRNLNVYTTSPGLQFYTGNQLKGDLYGKNGVQYVQYGGFATETQVQLTFLSVQKLPNTVRSWRQRVAANYSSFTLSSRLKFGCFKGFEIANNLIASVFNIREVS